MGALTAYAIGLDEPGGASETSNNGPSRPGRHFEHTWVGSSSGHAWGCWGRNEGGHQIVTGGGKHRIKMAKCLAAPRGTAAIAWGVTGTCHQCANRILFPAKKTVSKAKGYAGSVAKFGTFGRDYGTWQSNITRCSIETGTVPPFPRPPFPVPIPIPIPGPSNPTPFPLPIPVPRPPWLHATLGSELDGEPQTENNEDTDYYDALLAIYDSQDDPAIILARDFDLLLDYKLDHRLGNETRDQIRNLHVELQKDHWDVIKAVHCDELSEAEFPSVANSASRGTFVRLERILGEKQFVEVFDTTANSVEIP